MFLLVVLVFRITIFLSGDPYSKCNIINPGDFHLTNIDVVGVVDDRTTISGNSLKNDFDSEYSQV